tara:strand:+ start:164 stop:361 length:198 start_codon:yes stop_codon:yes gene_type:complete
MSMRDEITEILCDASPIEYPQSVADAIMELVQARIDKLEAELSDVDKLLLRLKEITSAALKGADA